MFICCKKPGTVGLVLLSIYIYSFIKPNLPSFHNLQNVVTIAIKLMLLQRLYIYSFIKPNIPSFQNIVTIAIKLMLLQRLLSLQKIAITVATIYVVAIIVAIFWRCQYKWNIFGNDINHYNNINFIAVVVIIVAIIVAIFWRRQYKGKHFCTEFLFVSCHI